MVASEPWATWGAALDPGLSREDLAGMVEDATGTLASVVERTPEPVLLRPRTVGEWSLRDCLAHCVVWSEYCTEVLLRCVEGTFRPEDFEYGDEEEFNLTTVREQQHAGTEELLRRLRAAGAETAGSIRGLPEDEWRARDRYRVVVGVAIVEHLAEHEAQFRSLIEAEVGGGPTG